MSFGAVQIHAQVQGYDTLQTRFTSLERQIAGTIVKRSVRAGIVPMNAALRSASEYTNRTGRLRKSFRVRVTSKQRGLITTGRTTTSVKNQRGKKSALRAGYAWLVEHGHRIAVGKSGRPEKNVVLRRRDGRGARAGQSYGSSAGFVPGRFYGRNAFARSAAIATRRFESTFFSGIEATI